MKKILLSLICFLACKISLHAQTLYGTTLAGGTDNVGTIIKFEPATNTLTVKKSFQISSGNSPAGSLLLASNGKIYGMTVNGGSNSSGTIYSFDTSSSVYTTLVNFNHSNGSTPFGSLIQANDGKLYGMTAYGGNNNDGVIFSFDISSSTYTKLFDFDGENGANPAGSLLQATNGKLYGMTRLGGTQSVGVAFYFDPATFMYTKLTDFGYPYGIQPYGSFIQATNGKLYGMTSDGYFGGVICSFNPVNSYFNRDEVDFRGGSQPIQGSTPYGSLVQASDGKLYGMTYYGGSNNQGTIFKFDPVSTYLTVVKSFNSDNSGASYPYGNLFQASDGKLYGSTNDGGIYSIDGPRGVIFSFNPSTLTYTKLIDFNGANGSNEYYGYGFIEAAECNTSRKYYRDADGDNYGNQYSYVIARNQPPGYVPDNTDCDDNNNAIHGPVTYYRDGDGDGFGDPLVTTSVCGLTAPAGYVTNNSDDNDHKALEYELSNYPNPFEGTSTIKYKLPSDSKVSIKVYDVTGIVVATLVDENKPAGIYSINFNAANSGKRFLYYKIVAQSKNGQFTQTNKMIQLQ